MTKRLDAGATKFTDRHLKAFRVIGEMGRISLDLLQVLLPRLDYMEWGDDGYTITTDIAGFLSFSEKIVETTPHLKRRSPKVSLTRVYQWVKPLRDAGYIVYDADVKIGQKVWVGTTQKADALVGREYLGKGVIALHEYEHTWAVNFMRLWFELWLAKKGINRYVLKTERVRVAEGGNTDGIFPDLEVWFGDTHDAIEVELTKKNTERYRQKKQSYRQHPAKRKLYFCPSKKLELIKAEFVGENGYFFTEIETERLENGERVARSLEDGTTYPF